jgi:DHA1 family tetracycline resistance protein-like MFS transporter
MVVSPLAMTQAFAMFSGPDAAVFFPGAPFALAGLLILAAMLIALPFMRLQEKLPSPSELDDRKTPAE